jgi:hypothetical protein
MSEPLGRRGFLGVSGAALLCAVGGKPLAERTAAEVDGADVAAARLRKPAAASEPVDSGRFPAPQPQPGGQKREYWIVARTVTWDIAPTGRDDWMDRRVPGNRLFRAYVYQRYSPGFEKRWGPAAMPGPTLEAEVGDTVVVHFRNADRRLRQAVTMHPHGLRYNPEYDGSYLGVHTRAGGFVAPGDEFTYTWEATPDSVGVWPYHDHGPNHTVNTMRGLFGAIVVRPRGVQKPDVEQVLVVHGLPPQVTRLERLHQAINGRVAAGNTPVIRSRVGQRVAIHVIGGDAAFHTFHIHGHRWKDAAGAATDNAAVGPQQAITAEFTEDNPGRWLYHCHVPSHQDAGMAGWYLVEP